MTEGNEEASISLTREQAFLYGSDLTHATVFLLNHQAPASIVKNLEELKELLRKAMDKKSQESK